MNWKTFGRDRSVILLLSLFFLLVFSGEFLSRLFIEKLWFESLGYSFIFWKRLLWDWGARVFAGVFAGIFIFGNLKLACKSVGQFRIRRQMGDVVISEELSAEYVNKIALVISLFFGSWFGLVVSSNLGIQMLFTLTGTEWGVVDPFFGKDLSFFVINLPFLETLLSLTMGIVMLTLVSVTITYVLSGVIGISNRIKRLQQRLCLRIWRGSTSLS